MQVEHKVQNAIKRAFIQLRQYLLAELERLKTEDGLLFRDEVNIMRMDTTIKTLRANMEMLGYREAIYTELNAMEEIVDDIKKKFRLKKLDDTLTTESELTIRALLTGAESELTMVANEAADQLGQIIRRATLGGGKIDDLIFDISKQLDIAMFRAETMASTALHSFHSVVQVQHALDLGLEWFVYLGPEDEVIRPWCQHWIDRRGTIEMFEATVEQWGRENQPSPVSAWRGGWNCRHELVPLVGDDVDKYKEGPR